MSLLRSEMHRKKNVRDILVDKGFIIIDGEYINQNSVFRFKCTSCDEEFDRSAGQALHTTTMCRKCSNFDNSYDDITRINELEKRGVQIINYISKNEIYVKCKICHDKVKTSYNKGLNGVRCKLCVSAITPISFENIISKIPSNITWVSGVYRNQNSELNVICCCGYKFKTTLLLLSLSNIGCKKCSQKQRMVLHRQTMESKEIWTKAKEITDKHKYNRLVDKYTKKSISQSNILDGITLGIGGSGLYQVDHMFSKFYGFKYNIPPYIIGSIHNLAVIHEKENASKGRKCSITLEELFSRFFNKE